MRCPQSASAVAATVQANTATASKVPSAASQEGTTRARSSRRALAATTVKLSAHHPMNDPAGASIALGTPATSRANNPGNASTIAAGNSHTSSVAHSSASCTASSAAQGTGSTPGNVLVAAVAPRRRRSANQPSSHSAATVVASWPSSTVSAGPIISPAVTTPSA